jgi:hypothetical protein
MSAPQGLLTTIPNHYSVQIINALGPAGGSSFGVILLERGDAKRGYLLTPYL